MNLKILILCGLLHTSSAALADDISIIDIRRNITLAENELPYKDFYINGGSGSGLKKNLVVTAVRKINIRDASGANAYGEIQVPVGQLKIIAVFDKLAVAREYSLLSRDDLPMLEQIGIMNGDRIDLQGSFIDKSKPKPKPQAALPAAITSPVALLVTTTDSAAQKAPASIAAETQVAVALSPTPATSEKLEKVGDSGNNSPYE